MQMAKDLLNLAGFATLEAPDAITGISLAQDRHPDLILMDMHLPLCDGYEATRRLKAEPTTHNIPVLAFTALAMENEQKRALDAGCIGVICKPIDVETFAQTVSTYLPHNGGGGAPSPVSFSVQGSRMPGVNRDTPEMNVSRSISSISSDEYEGFINRVSHDLQSPLRKIRQFSGFLKDSAKTELSAENYQMLESLDRSAAQMYDLLSGLLQLSRVGRLETNMTEFNLLAVINEAMQNNQAAIHEKKAEVELGDMAVVEGNYQQLVQLFTQLIENALKYSAMDRTPRLVIHCLARVNTGMAEITVQDNGIGFKSEYADMIFQPLKRLHGVSQFSGVGLGLALVKKIVERHQGSIRVESEPDRGTTFTIALPLRQTAHML